MRRYIIRRILQMILLFIGVSFIIFLIFNVMGDPFAQLAAVSSIRPEDIIRLRHQWGFDLPVYLRFFKWFWAMIRGNWGISIFGGGRPTTELIGNAINWTLKFSLLSFILSVGIGIPIGIYSALHQYSIFDNIFTIFAFFGMSMPTFWFGFMLMMIFGLKFHLLPLGGVMTPGMETASFFLRILDQIKYFVLPVIVLSFYGMGSWTRYARTSMLEVLHQDYLRTARAKGLSERVVIIKHALKNALIPIVTLLGLHLPALISGAMVIETVFAIPGMGRLTLEAMMNNDYMLAMACLLLDSIFLIIGNFIADLMYVIIDPRIKYS